MKTGLYFGSFNPIHMGHLAIANFMIEFSDLKQLWFVVSPQNPLKEKKSLLKDYHRLEMVRLAIDDDDRFRASDIEFRLPTPSYTIDTLAYLEEKYPGREFQLVMGADGLIVTGTSTGEPTSVDHLAEVRAATGLPVIVGSGVTPGSVASLLEHADALIVGSWYKAQGHWGNPPDPERVSEMVKAVGAGRGSG